MEQLKLNEDRNSIDRLVYTLSFEAEKSQARRDKRSAEKKRQHFLAVANMMHRCIAKIHQGDKQQLNHL